MSLTNAAMMDLSDKANSALLCDINQVLWGKSIDLLTSTTVFNDGDGVSIDNRVINVVFELLQQLQQARREGWEQAKREAVEAINNLPNEIYSVRYLVPYLSKLEYKESTK